MNRDPDQHVFRTVLGVFHEHIEVAVVVEYAGIEQFVFKFLPRPFILFHQVAVGELPLRILVQVLHVGVRGRAVDVEVVLLYVLAVVAFAVGQPEHPFLQDGVTLIPQSDSKAQPLLFVTDAAHAILAPTVGA